HDATVLLRVADDDAVVVVVQQFGPGQRYSLPRIPSAVSLHDIWWHPQPNHTIDASAAAAVMLVIPLLVDQVVADKARRVATGLGEKRLFAGEGQLELLVQPLSDVVLEGFGFTPWTGESEQPIIGVPHIPQSTVGWVAGVLRGKPLSLFAESLYCFPM